MMMSISKGRADWGLSLRERRRGARWREAAKDRLLLLLLLFVTWLSSLSQLAGFSSVSIGFELNFIWGVVSFVSVSAWNFLFFVV